MTILTYLRVSTDGQTVEPQRQELAEYCSRQGWTVAAEYSDVISGTKAVRPGLKALLERCAASPKPDLVLVVKLDRLGRSVINVVTLVQKLSSLGVAVLCTSQGIDTRKSNPCGALILSIMAAFAEFERDIIRERTCAGLNVARAAGKTLGRPSPTLVAESERPEIFASWEIGGRVGGYRGLASLLKCSPMTARRLLKEHTTITLASPSTSPEQW